MLSFALLVVFCENNSDICGINTVFLGYKLLNA